MISPLQQSLFPLAVKLFNTFPLHVSENLVALISAPLRLKWGIRPEEQYIKVWNTLVVWVLSIWNLPSVEPLYKGY